MAANGGPSLEERLVAPVSNVSDFIGAGTWDGVEVLAFPSMTLILLGMGLWIMVGLKFYPIVKLGSALKGLFAGRKGQGEGEISPFAALSTALSGQAGTGNLAGVATAIALGGPGAVFWMWITALFGMALAFAQGALSIRYRERTPDGAYRGGPMTYIRLGLGPNWTWLAVVFCVSTLFSALVTGNSIEANEVASGLKELFGWERWVGGLMVAVAVFVVIIGGIKTIGNIAEKVVPLMAFAYVAMALTALVLNASELPETFGRIFAGAFSYQSASGRFLGAALILFVFTTLLTWSYCGERAITFIYDRIPGATSRGEKVLHVAWRVVWCVAIYVGATQPSELVSRLGDISNAAMALPNLLALALRSGVVFALARGDRKAGPDHAADTRDEPGDL